jgi:hypothetical protein
VPGRTLGAELLAGLAAASISAMVTGGGGFSITQVRKNAASASMIPPIHSARLIPAALSIVAGLARTPG